MAQWINKELISVKGINRRLCMNPEATSQSINLQLVESLVEAIRSLSTAEQTLLEQKLFSDIPEPSTQELMHLASKGGAFDFLHNEPDVYTIEDGEPV
jgi:hypothetical protein